MCRRTALPDNPRNIEAKASSIALAKKQQGQKAHCTDQFTNWLLAVHFRYSRIPSMSPLERYKHKTKKSQRSELHVADLCTIGISKMKFFMEENVSKEQVFQFVRQSRSSKYSAFCTTGIVRQQSCMSYIARSPQKSPSSEGRILTSAVILNSHAINCIAKSRYTQYDCHHVNFANLFHL